MKLLIIFVLYWKIYDIIEIDDTSINLIYYPIRSYIFIKEKYYKLYYVFSWLSLSNITHYTLLIFKYIRFTGSSRI